MRIKFKFDTSNAINLLVITLSASREFIEDNILEERSIVFDKKCTINYSFYVIENILSTVLHKFKIKFSIELCILSQITNREYLTVSATIPSGEFKEGEFYFFSGELNHWINEDNSIDFQRLEDDINDLLESIEELQLKVIFKLKK